MDTRASAASKFVRATCFIAAFGLLFSCDESDEKSEPPAPTPVAASIQIEPATLHLDAVGATQQLRATVLDEEGQELESVRVQWTSSLPSTVSVSETGEVRAVANGEAAVEAHAEGLSASLPVTVAQAAAELRLQPEILHLAAVGASVKLQVEARDRNGHRVDGAALVWRSGDETIATVDDEGRVTAVAAGSTTVIAEVAGSETTARAEVVVAPKPVGLVFEFATQPWSAGEPADVRVRIQDEAGHTVASSGTAVRLRFGESVPGSRLQGNLLATSSEGVAHFSGLQIDRTGGPYSLIAQVDGIGTWESPLFEVLPGAPARLAFRTQPTTVRSGAVLAPAVVVELQDRSGNRVDAELAVDLSLESPAGGTLQGQTRVDSVGGVAVFDTLVSDRAGIGNILVASAAGLETARGLPFEVRPGPAASLSFLQAPTTGTSGLPLNPAPTVVLLDAAGNRANDSLTVRLSLASQPGPGELQGPRSVQAVDGVATFPGLSLHLAGAGYVLRAEAEGLAPAQSGRLDISAGKASRLAFAVQPAPVAAGAALPTIEVRLLDAAGNLVEDNTRVSLALENAGGASLLGSSSVNAAQGVARFPALSIQRAGQNYLLRASADGLQAVLSQPFDVSAAAAAQLAFTGQPHHLRSGAAFSELRVELRDAFGNRVFEDGRAVRIELGHDPSGKASLSGTTQVATAQGVARFGDIGVRVAASGYTLWARSGALEVESARFDVSPGTASQLAFLSEPQDLRSGVPFSVSVEVRDAAGNRVDGSSAAVSLGLQGGAGPLQGDKSASAKAGVATFSQLRIGASGSTYALVASATGLTPATTGQFSVRPGPATQLAIRTQPPASAVAGQAWTPALVVEARDAAGNQTSDVSGSVTLSIDRGTGGAKLLGTRSVTLVGGSATFPGLAIDKAGNDYVLRAEAPSLQTARSDVFAVVAGDAVSLSFQRQPQGGTSGQDLLPVEVVLRDAFGNLASQPAPQVRLTLQGNPAATLGGTTQQSPSAGVASFSGLRVDKAGAGYTLLAEAQGLAAATSLPFAITPAAASQLAFLTEPQNGTAGQSLVPALRVEARDAQGNPVPGATGQVVLRLGANPGNATLSGSRSSSLHNGVASFANVILDKAGEDYTLVAEAAGLAAIESASFDIVPASAARLAFSLQPGTGKAGLPLPAVEVEIRDSFGNLLPTATAPVTLSLGSASANLLHGVTVATPSNGVARFDGLRLDLAAGGYTLIATSPGLAAAQSLAFAVEAGDATRMRFLDQPARSVAGQPWSSLRIELQDAFDNRAVHFADEVELVLEGGPAGAFLDGVTRATPAAGIVTFAGLSVAKAGEGYALAASAPNVATRRSQAFGIDPGAPAELAFVPQPKGTIADELLDLFSLEIRDAVGNLVPAADTWVSLALGNQPQDASLLGTASRFSQGGVATFDDLRLPKAGSYTLIASIPSGVQQESEAFAISTGHAVKLSFLAQPSDATALAPIAPTVSVAFLDASDNLVESTETVTLRAGAGSPAGATLTGSTAQAVAGIATFPSLAIDLAGGYTLVAEGDALQSDPSDAFQIRHGAAEFLVFQGDPSDVVSQEAMSPVEVAVLDGAGNLVLDASGPVTLSPAPGSPFAANLSGESATPVDGVATFDDLRIDRAGTYELIASMGALQSSPSVPFDVLAGPATVLIFSQDPSGAAAGSTFSAALAWQDDAGNPSHSDALIDLAVADEAPGLLQGYVPSAATQGVLQVNTLRIDQAGEDYYLIATAGGASAYSADFDIVHGEATQIAWVAKPSDAKAGQLLDDVTVEVQDAFGNRVFAFEDEMEAELVVFPLDGTLGGGASTFAQQGRATFDTLWANKTGDYELTVTADGLLSPPPAAFFVDHADPTRLEFVAWPLNGVAGEALDRVEVALFDDYDNLAEGSTLSVSIALLGGPGTLSGTQQQSAIVGVALFADLIISAAGTGYKLEASATGAPSIQSPSFDVTRCPGSMELCPGDICVATHTDVENCGQCDFDCRAQDNVGSATCSTGACVFTCEPGFRDCDGDRSTGCEVDSNNDPLNCGGCGEDFACGAGESCVNGACKVPCEEGTVADKWGNCVDPDWDPNHCGPDGKFCPNGCFKGSCVGDAATASNWSHSCAIANGVAKCWGNAGTGQLGAGTVSGNQATGQLVLDFNLPDYTPLMVSAGYSSTCGLAQIDGVSSAMCWGTGTEGQLGNGSNDNHRTAQLITSITDVSHIEISRHHACAVAGAEGKVYCWGTNLWGQLGRADTSTNVPLPVLDSSAQPLTKALRVSVGPTHSCALMRDRTVLCWGDNSTGQLGNTTAGLNAWVPRPVVDGDGNLERIAMISAGGSTTNNYFAYHSCAVTMDGKVKCWGNNQRGQLGNNNQPNSSDVPVDIVNPPSPLPSLPLFAQVSVGADHTCAVSRLGGAFCWGNNGTATSATPQTSGKLGGNTNVGSQGRPYPQQVTKPDTSTPAGAFFENVRYVGAGGDHTCATDAGKKVYCWGIGTNNRNGTNNLARGYPSTVTF